MASSKFRAVLLLLKGMDLLGMILAFLLAMLVTSYSDVSVSFQNFLGLRLQLVNVVLFVILLTSWSTMFTIMGLYSESALFSRNRNAMALLKAVIFATIFLAVAGVVFEFSMVTAMFLVVFGAACTLFCLIFRSLVRGIAFSGRSHDKRKQTLIIGTNNRAMDFFERIEAKPEMGYSLLGFVDSGWYAAADYEYLKDWLVSDFEGLQTFIRENVVDEVVICVPIKSLYDTASNIVSICEEQGIPVTISTQIFNMENPRMRQKHFKEDLVLTIYSTALDEGEMAAKRLTDIVLSFIALVLLSPVFLVISVAIKLTSKGPVFFVQDRVGLNKRLFKCLKFRSMVTNATEMQEDLEKFNESDGGSFKMTNDPRVTSVGRFLRKTSLDELPQFINVFLGHMSIVGPRPLPVRDVRLIEKDWPRRRFSVRPGITCFWQIQGRKQSNFDNWMELDMMYIDNWSLWLDFKIMFMTVPAVLAARGAH